MKKGYVKKEILECVADDSDYTPNGEGYETTFSCDTTNYDSMVCTQHRWKGKVRITIEQINDEIMKEQSD